MCSSVANATNVTNATNAALDQIEKGLRAKRTIIGIVFSQDGASIQRLAKKYVAEGATMHTEELAGYTMLSKQFRHRTVNHSKEFSTDDGVSNNQAESFFSRVRRFIIGQVHRVTFHYMYEYMNEMAWREDTRREPPSQQLATLAGPVIKWSSRKSRGYWAGKDRPYKVKVDGFADTLPPSSRTTRWRSSSTSRGEPEHLDFLLGACGH